MFFVYEIYFVKNKKEKKREKMKEKGEEKIKKELLLLLS